VDIVIPFVGSDDDLRALAEVMARIERVAGDTITIADNRPDAQPGERDLAGVTVRGAAGQPSSYFARNRGVTGGANPWLVFLDADVIPSADILTKYFDGPISERVGILIGGIYDAPPQGERATAVELYSMKRGAVGHGTTTRMDGFTFAQTANVAIRREAYEAVNGFTEGIRSGGDADLCFRIRDAGWTMEPRFEARVEHVNRASLRAFWKQYARYGSGAAWLERRYPGFAPRPRAVRLAIAFGASAVRSTVALLRRRPDDAKVYILDSVQRIAMLEGRRRSNDVAS
jgi:GT2 family glycosyltransferase